ncbi:MAG: signal recognition particle-docking protein FtsY [Amoebophilaceae bacterium]|nr:signal recognition particle-docking protein FtsY [Amoebophilaceae bacterium]
MGIFDFFSKKEARKEILTEEISKTRQSFWSRFSKVIAGKSTVDQSVLDKLEELLISSDVGMATTLKLITAIEHRVAKDKYLNTTELDKILQDEVEKLLHVIPATAAPLPSNGLQVILVVGVNGVGKTTTIGKLAARFIQEGKKVVLGAADTFRAAALEQLTIWGNRVGAVVIGRATHTDPSSVAYEAVQYGMQHGSDVVIIDTAGRLHTKVPLVNELSKIKRTIQKCYSNAPSEVLLILDGTMGQNAFVQAQAFTAAVEVTGIVITKLDGTSKGGVVLGIADQFAIPIKYVGVGEKVEDLTLFDSRQFIASLFQNWQP